MSGSSEMWSSAIGATAPSAGGSMMDTVKGWAFSWKFWLVVGLALLAVIMFIGWMATLAQKNETVAAPASTYKKAQQQYMPDPGAPAKKMLNGTATAAGYATLASSDPNKVLQQALRA